MKADFSSIHRLVSEYLSGEIAARQPQIEGILGPGTGSVTEILVYLKNRPLPFAVLVLRGDAEVSAT